MIMMFSSWNVLLMMLIRKDLVIVGVAAAFDPNLLSLSSRRLVKPMNHMNHYHHNQLSMTFQSDNYINRKNLNRYHHYQPYMKMIRKSDMITTSTLQMSENNNNNNDIWKQQKELMNQMKDKENKTAKNLANEKYSQRAIGLVNDSIFISFLIFAILWTIQSNPFIPISYLLGTSCGIAYTYGLSKYVETIGQSVDDVLNNEGGSSGAGFGAARFAFLLILFVLVNKYRSYGLLEIPSIFGFFTYQIASLSQGLREIND